MTRTTLAAMLAAVLAVLAVPSRAQVPQVVNYQGRLLQGTNLVNGSVGLSLRLYSAAAGGAPLYEDSNTVAVADGLYATLMGDQTNAGSFAQALTNAQVWVEVAVNGTALAPRERLASAAYALRAGGVPDGAITTAMLAPDAVTGDRIADGAVGDADIAPAAAIAGSKIAAGTFVRVAGDTMTGALTNQQGVTAALFRNAHNTAALDSASAVGGTGNTASGDHATVGGGQDNAAAGNNTAVGGGYANNGSGHVSVIGGGFANEAGAYCATVGGGRTNRAGGYAATVGGGYGNAATGMYAAVAGGLQNGAGADGAAIAGGRLNTIGGLAQDAAIGGGGGNVIDFSSCGGAIAGGQGNTIMPHATNCVIAGGCGNVVGFPYDPDALGSTPMQGAGILGGYSNLVRRPFSIICGGLNNRAYQWLSFVGCGEDNQASNDYAVIAGGLHNRALAYASVVAGGRSNVAAGRFAFAAGFAAKARHDGCFVWNDSDGEDFASTGTNQFLIRAAGGVGIGTPAPAAALQVESAVQRSERLRLSGAEFFAGNTASDGPALLLGVNRPNNRQLWIGDSANLAVNATNAVIRLVLLGATAQIDAYATDGATPRNLGLGLSMMLSTNGNVGIGTAAPTNKLDVAGNVTAWGYYTTSDRALKEHITPVDAEQVLEKVAALPIAQWNFTAEPGVAHVGPMAQDFHAAFQLGQNDRTIATVDEGGVALAAIQALKRQVEAQQRQIEELRARLEQLTTPGDRRPED